MRVITNTFKKASDISRLIEKDFAIVPVVIRVRT